MPGSKYTGTGDIPIIELFTTPAHQTLAVPKFQRDYEWDDKKIETLWNDVLENYAKFKDETDPIKPQYMLGPIVLLKNKAVEGEWYVVDGQQRLATLTILFCVIRDVLLDFRPPKPGEEPTLLLDTLKKLNGTNNKICIQILEIKTKCNRYWFFSRSYSNL